MKNHLKMEYQKEQFRVSTDKSLINVALVHNFLCHYSYWAEDISIDIVQKKYREFFVLWFV
jgi:hypothetical protein